MSSYTGIVPRGRTWKIQVQWLLDGLPVDITGYTLRASFLKDNNAAPLTTLSIGSGVTITNAVAGQFQLKVGRSATSVWLPGAYIFDVLAISPDDEASTVFSGSLTVTEAVTR